MKIGIPGYQIEGGFGVAIDYLDYIGRFGEAVILSPSTEIPKVDAVFLPGGPDVVQRGVTPSFHLGKPSPFLEFFDFNVLPKILFKIPVVGICRGLQTINVALGGTLHQHLYGHPFSSFDSNVVHTVKNPGSKKAGFGVNSFHHQGIDRMARGLAVELVSTDGVIEAISGDNVFAVQWHPERLLDDYSLSCIYKLLRTGRI